MLDYSHASLPAHRICDEIREVAPDLYLGVVLGSCAKILNFTLDFGR